MRERIMRDYYLFIYKRSLTLRKLKKKRKEAKFFLYVQSTL